jgi:hypothetical protein
VIYDFDATSSLIHLLQPLPDRNIPEVGLLLNHESTCLQPMLHHCDLTSHLLYTWNLELELPGMLDFTRF